ncbi:AAA family ATPase [Labrys neptuniae]|uniref:AAA family ATPase n=1 Tax=Labrys neptuniae TaxID=376174 RepID=A0ABV3PPH9_9HYPH
MGSIHEDVKSGHLTRHPEELDWLKCFQNGFDVTWANERRAYGSRSSVYFIKPEPSTEETFGVDKEILLIYSPYDKLEARTFLSIEQFINDDPARGRVERLFVILVSDAKNPEKWVTEYASTNEARMVVAINKDDLKNSTGNAWFVRSKIASQLFSRDLFDYRLPLEKDIYFFGRTALLQSFTDSARRGENRGLFGLRKTGKTSFLYKLRRDLQEQGEVEVLFYDCKSPSIRQRSWVELLQKIIFDLAAVGVGDNFIVPKDNRFLSETLADLIKNMPGQKRVAIIFDEVEYISHFSKTDNHWKRDYLPFWQSIWAAQSETRKLSTILAGVNPKLVEVDKIDGIQNPLFGIVPYNYLSGLSVDEVRRMLNVLGRRMGLKFVPEIATTFDKEYGGHPLLCRLAASFTYRQVREGKKNFPIKVDISDLSDLKIERDGSLVFYCGHVVSELRDFYPDEYQVFELLACGRTADYIEFSYLPEYSDHLNSYGLVKTTSGIPTVAIEVVGTYVAMEAARREGRKTIQKLIDASERTKWISVRLQDIDFALDDLHRLGTSGNLPTLFGPNKYPESHKFMALKPAQNQGDLQLFLNVCNRCLVESIEAYGKSIANKNYFWETIRTAYPSLHQSLHRIKVYRHNEFHIELNEAVDAVYRDFLRQDLEGRNPTSVHDVWFTLQQAVLDSLWNALQIELSRYGR